MPGCAAFEGVEPRVARGVGRTQEVYRLPAGIHSGFEEGIGVLDAQTDCPQCGGGGGVVRGADDRGAEAAEGERDAVGGVGRVEEHDIAG